MSFINFESARVKEQIRSEKRRAQAAVLEKVEGDYKRRKEREVRAAERGDDKWMLPSLEAQLESGSKKKKVKKEKKKKKEKKHKKHKSKKKDDSSDNDDSSDDEEGQWVEKANMPTQDATSSSAEPVQRDEWMTMSALFPCTTRDQIRAQKRLEKTPTPQEEEAIRKKFLLDNPGQSDRELNPYWKDGGKGLPQSHEPEPEHLSLPAGSAGDHGVAWLRRGLRRVEEQAKEEGRSMEDVAAERWGSLEKLKTMLSEAEQRRRVAHRGDRGRGGGGYRGGRVQGPKPKPREYEDWREDPSAGQSEVQSEAVGDKSKYRAWLGIQEPAPQEEPPSENENNDSDDTDDEMVKELKRQFLENEKKEEEEKRMKEIEENKGKVIEKEEEEDKVEEEEDVETGGKIIFRMRKNKRETDARIKATQMGRLAAFGQRPKIKVAEYDDSDDDKAIEEWKEERRKGGNKDDSDEDNEMEVEEKKETVEKKDEEMKYNEDSTSLGKEAKDGEAAVSDKELCGSGSGMDVDGQSTRELSRRPEGDQKVAVSDKKESGSRSGSRDSRDRGESPRDFGGRWAEREKKGQNSRERTPKGEMRKEGGKLEDRIREGRREDERYRERREGDRSREREERKREMDDRYKERGEGERKREKEERRDVNGSERDKERGGERKRDREEREERRGERRREDERDRDWRDDRERQRGYRRTEVPEYLKKRSSSEPYEKLPPRKALVFRKPDEEAESRARHPDVLGGEVRVFQCSSRGKNWKKKEFQKVEEKQETAPPLKETAPVPEPEPEQEEEPEETVVLMTDAEMNTLAAKLMKAEILGNQALVTQLKQQLQKAQAGREHRKVTAAAPPPARNTQKPEEEAVLLTRRDAKGFVRPVTAPEHPEPSGGRRRPQKVATHSAGGLRERFFPDDDKYSLENMFQQEKMTTVEDANEEFSRLAGKAGGKADSEYDLDDIFTETAAREVPKGKLQVLERNRAIREHKRVERSLDSCLRCFDSQRMLKHLLISLGDKVYLSLPAHQSLAEGHCFLSPVHHVPCATQLDEDVWEEMGTFRKALVAMFAARDLDCVFYESAMHLKRFPHMTLECVPLPRDVGDTAPIYFKKAIMESEAEWSMNKKLVELKGKGVRRAVPKGLPYFAVDFGLEDGFAHVIEDEKLFPENFAQEIIGGMLDLDHTLWRKQKKDTFEAQRKKVLQFAEWWKTFDFTQKKDDSGDSSNSDSN